MTDYTKYAEIKTEEVTGKSYNNDIVCAFNSRAKKVNNTLEKLLSEGYEIINIKYESVAEVPCKGDVLAVATIIYGKLKDTVKK